MLPRDLELPDSADILKALGELALAASRAEAFAAQALYYLLADGLGDEEGAARVSAEFRSFDSLCRLLSIALRGETPLGEILELARNEAQKVDRHGDPLIVATSAVLASIAGQREYLTKYAARSPRATPVDYLMKVKALYNRRNECLHALGMEAAGDETHLYKRKKDGTKDAISPQKLVAPCMELSMARPMGRKLLTAQTRRAARRCGGARAFA